ncbi:L-threonylcarbamoyladenylate synthase [Ornithobacterium rhinotracheale]|uniref:L-threonylcarbamoyladenylate synthase n=1 Tax=Ornithobacterium rhinotracheale (strain ATCC 51463 / DSM 15997 / CCUG 23171 / CIP 104009 / LMG 9086) TaxID=867902 RepID=I3ZXM0_ORNRL|nr:L-threonylcarbamoyladenylate synthase [Ornithobacterium rhinotracheale]AFL96454.1 Sua5/YciO/YrdC/YwlC family protein [Ornithobacterium rhinotracheale DSM 15997]AIP98664.1 translation factor Sua5 [Ornithobacterium rhinotracheale ORT-UMN 88]KGB67655.1 translation factor Sua5 [Ornithobacterium rhinotracheale H06-030791]MCK0194782.1 L-threonylcarbamoyladenylate synthase [Ornithobacterium rhinotracheale]UOH62973.1 L-threonylcarbamoyladenylate synthase [Ornithobacterium rhinotracheale]
MSTDIAKVAEILQDGGVILTHTDTTFGLSCLVSNQAAIDKIFEIKQRPKNKSFILLVDNPARLQQVVEVPELAWDLMDLSEKPVSIVYDKILSLPKYVLAPDGSVAIRMVKDPVLQRIIGKVREPLISTSVNISGEAAPETFSQINPEILEKVDYILPEAKDFVPKFTSSSIIKLGIDGQVKVIRA